MNKIPEVILTASDMKGLMPINGEFFTTYSEGDVLDMGKATAAGLNDVISATGGNTPSGFRMYLPEQMGADRPIILGWTNRAIMSMPGRIKPPLEFLKLPSDDLNRRFHTVFKGCKLSLLPVYFVSRTEMNVDELIATDIQTASHVLLWVVWPEGHAPRYGRKSRLINVHQGRLIARVTADKTNAHCGFDYWLMPKQSLGVHRVNHLISKHKDNLDEYRRNWRAYKREREAYRRSMRDLAPALRERGFILDCGDPHCAILHHEGALDSRKFWYAEDWLQELSLIASGSNIEIFELQPGATCRDVAKVG